jgi:hypothetical protein
MYSIAIQRACVVEWCRTIGNETLIECLKWPIDALALKPRQMTFGSCSFIYSSTLYIRVYVSAFLLLDQAKSV